MIPQIVDGDPFSTGNLQKSEFFRKKVAYTLIRSAPATPLKSATLWGSCCLKTTLVVFVAKNCWFYQNLKKIGTTNENWIVGRWGGTNLLPILYFESMATKEVSHFSSLSLTFLFVKWTNLYTQLLIPFLTKKWPHMRSKSSCGETL